MDNLEIRIVNRACLQAHDLPWHSVDSEVTQRSRWPFRVKHKDADASPKDELPVAGNDKLSFNFTT